MLIQYHKYEEKLKTFISTKNNVVVRLDGVQFHKKYINDVSISFSMEYKELMDELVNFITDNMDGVICVYIISDEINIFFSKSSKFISNKKSVQKLSSIISGMIAVFISDKLGTYVYYDGRSFNLDNNKLYRYIYNRKSMGYNTYIQYELKKIGLLKHHVFDDLPKKERALEMTGKEIRLLDPFHIYGILYGVDVKDSLLKQFEEFDNYSAEYLYSDDVL